MNEKNRVTGIVQQLHVLLSERGPGLDEMAQASDELPQGSHVTYVDNKHM